MGISSEHRVHSEREPRGEKLLWKTFVNLPLSSGNPSGPIPLSCMMRVKPCFELGWSRQEWSMSIFPAGELNSILAESGPAGVVSEVLIYAYSGQGGPRYWI